MASRSESVGGESGPEGPAGGVRVGDRFPMSESTFVLIELGKLMSQSENTTRTLEKQADKLEKLSDKVGKLDETVKAARLIGTVLVGVVTVLAGAMWWVGAALWPARQKLIAVLLG